MKSAKEFDSFYTTTLYPVLKELEAERKRLVPIYYMYVVLAASLAIIFVFFSHIEFPASIFVVLFALVLGSLLFNWINSKSITSIKHRFKGEVIANIIGFIDSNLSYNATSYISEATYRQSKLFLTGVDRYNGDDLVSGTIGKTSISFSEIHSEYKTRDSKGRTSWHTIFKGLFFMADFNKHFSGETIVLPDTAESVFGSLGTMFQKMNISRDELIKLENPEFEKIFAVYSNNPLEAHYILSPKLMESLVEFKKKSGTKIHLSFINSTVFIALSTSKNLFEPPLFSSMLKTTLIEEYHKYLILAIGIVEDLDLNTRIWTKE